MRAPESSLTRPHPIDQSQSDLRNSSSESLRPIYFRDPKQHLTGGMTPFEGGTAIGFSPNRGIRHMVGQSGEKTESVKTVGSVTGIALGGAAQKVLHRPTERLPSPIRAVVSAIATAIDAVHAAIVIAVQVPRVIRRVGTGD